MDNQKVIVKEYMLSHDEIKEKFPIDSQHAIDGKIYRVVAHRPPLPANCFASYPQVMFELVEE